MIASYASRGDISAPSEGSFVTLESTIAEREDEGSDWDVSEQDSSRYMVLDVEYEYNDVAFQEDGEHLANRVYAYIWVFVEPVPDRP
jgi:hypothetical protein